MFAIRQSMWWTCCQLKECLTTSLASNAPIAKAPLWYIYIWFTYKIQFLFFARFLCVRSSIYIWLCHGLLVIPHVETILIVWETVDDDVYGRWATIHPWMECCTARLILSNSSRNLAISAKISNQVPFLLFYIFSLIFLH